MSLSPLVSFQSRFVSYLLTSPRINPHLIHEVPLYEEIVCAWCSTQTQRIIRLTFGAATFNLDKHVTLELTQLLP